MPAYVLSFGDALFQELSGTKTTVTTLCPGVTDTGMVHGTSLGGLLGMMIMPLPKKRDIEHFCPDVAVIFEAGDGVSITKDRIGHSGIDSDDETRLSGLSLADHFVGIESGILNA